VKKYIGDRTSGFLFETSRRLPMSPRNVARDSLHPILKNMGRESAGSHTFRRFRESILKMSQVRNVLIDFWMGHANGEMSGRYGKQLLDNIKWRQECAAKVDLGFTLPEVENEALLDKSGQLVHMVHTFRRITALSAHQDDTECITKSVNAARSRCNTFLQLGDGVYLSRL